MIIETYYIKTECLNRQGNIVTRYLDIVRGMSDSGQPGWASTKMFFETYNEALEYSLHPYSYSCWNSVYKGAEIHIMKRTTYTYTSISDEIWLPT